MLGKPDIRRDEPLDAERPDQRLCDPVQHQARDRIGGNRREQNAIAMVAGRIDETWERRGAEDRRVVPAARAMVRIVQVVDPRPSYSAAYGERYARFLEACRQRGYIDDAAA